MSEQNENHFESYVDENTGTVIVSEVPSDEVTLDLAGFDSRVSRAISEWRYESTDNKRQARGLFQRNRFVTPGSIYKQMAMAYDAADDEVVSSVLDTSEAIAFQKVGFECEDHDQEDVWNQIARDINLDGWFRSAYRELFLVSHFYGIVQWGVGEYKVRGKGDGGRAKRKTYKLWAPKKLGFLDPLRVVPVNNNPFGEAEFAWVGNDYEMSLVDDIGQRVTEDPFMDQLFVGKYEPSKQEAKDLREEGISVERLLRLNPQMVFRHTLTKAPYERWPRLRMKSVFPLLDLKHQLREMDRAFLLGGINFIVLITRGSDDKPTNATELQATVGQVKAQSKSPIIISDHRIKIEIITPDISHVLDPKKWDVLDERLLLKLWGTFSLPSQRGPGETSLTEGRIIARGLSNRRHMIKRTVEDVLVKGVHDSGLNGDFDAPASIDFQPRRIELEFDDAVASIMQSLRDRGDISRETILNELDFDQEIEARRRKKEAETYDDIFTPVNVPFDSPDKTTPGGSGRVGTRDPKKDQNQK